MSTSAPGGSRYRGVARWLDRNRSTLGLVPAIIVICLIGINVSPAFATPRNAITILQSSAVLGVLVVAQSLVLLCGYLDLSLESTVAFAPMLAIWLMTAPPLGLGMVESPWLGLVIAILTGAVVGLTNGILIVRLKLNGFMTTLAMLILLRGLTYAMTNGATISEPAREVVFIGQGVVFGIPIQIFFTIGLFIAAALFLNYHRVGRAIYAVGGNAEAARAAGIRVDRVLIEVFVAASILAAIAGLILTGRVNAVTVQQGQGEIFNVFAACVIGGISLNGGRGSVLSAALGVLFLAVITNVLTLAQVPSQVIDAVRGLVILVALALNRFTFRQ